MGRCPDMFANLLVTTYPPLTPVNHDHRLLGAACGLASAHRSEGCLLHSAEGGGG
jgi:mRNA-degrading endonuclease YafQ of YafQ-DinJ toxin-antitoxin module